MDPTHSLISVILPLYNEAQNVPSVLGELFAELEKLSAPFEVIAVDDGSTDGTFQALRDLGHPCLVIIRLRRNFGQTAAMSAGFDNARGDIFITMDADGQNDPRDIPRLLEGMARGADIVSGWRKDRKEAFLTRRLPSQLANRLISKVTGVRLHDYGCTLKAYSAQVINETRLYGELHRFVPALASWAGDKVEEIEVRHHARRFGSSNYGLSRTFRVILDLMTVKFLLSFGTRPIHMFGTVGFASLVSGLFIGGYLAFVRLALKESIADRPLLLGAVGLVLVGLQFISMGLISELLVRIYHESSNRRIYVIAETHGPDQVTRSGETTPDATCARESHDHTIHTRQPRTSVADRD